MSDPQTFLTTIAQEQAWNHRQMLEPVAQPRFRVWTYGAPAIVLGCSQRRFEEEARARLAPWEVVDAAGRKLVGLAQRRQRTGVLLVAGTLVAPPDWALLCHALGQSGDEAAMRRRTVSCAQLSAQAPHAQHLARALHEALEQGL